MSENLVIIDIETTGLHDCAEVIEVAWWDADSGNDGVYELVLPHTLALAQSDALRINNYHQRELWDRSLWCLPEDIHALRASLDGKTLMGAQVGAFDAMHLARITGRVWHHRFFEIESWAAGRMGFPRPLSLRETAEQVRSAGGDVPEPDHTAAGDVRTVRAIWRELMAA